MAQTSVPELADLSRESAATRELYGVEDDRPSFARNCLLARRMVERGVRFVQLFHRGWDQHLNLVPELRAQCRDVDQPTAALLKDLKERGLLRDTLVVFCTEFGRMPTFQKGASGRDHNPSGFTTWLAGAGVKAGFTYGATDDFGYKAAVDPVTVYDFYATVLHILGLDHERLSFYHNGIERRLTDVHGHVIKEVLA